MRGQYRYIGRLSMLTGVDDNTGSGFDINNPGNITYNPNASSAWQGATGHTEATDSLPSFVVFSSVPYGIRAMAINLVNGYFRKGINTPAAITKKWGQPTNATNLANNFLNIGVNDPIPFTRDSMISQVNGISDGETSRTPDPADVASGIEMAEHDKPLLFDYTISNIVQKAGNELKTAKAGFNIWEGLLLSGIVMGAARVIYKKRFEK